MGKELNTIHLNICQNWGLSKAGQLLPSWLDWKISGVVGGSVCNLSWVLNSRRQRQSELATITLKWFPVLPYRRSWARQGHGHFQTSQSSLIQSLDLCPLRDPKQKESVRIVRRIIQVIIRWRLSDYQAFNSEWRQGEFFSLETLEKKFDIFLSVSVRRSKN